MKNIIIFITIFAMSTQAFAQLQKSVVPVVAQANDYIQLIENKYNQQVVNLDFEIIGTQKAIYKQLYKGVQYGIIIYGDENIAKLSLDILQADKQGQWQVIKSDNQNKGIVMIYFTPSADDLYILNIKSTLQENKTFGFFGLIIFR